jgi:hypothetical protein
MYYVISDHLTLYNIIHTMSLENNSTEDSQVVEVQLLINFDKNIGVKPEYLKNEIKTEVMDDDIAVSIIC